MTPPHPRRLPLSILVLCGLVSTGPAFAGGPLDDDDNDGIVNNADNCVLVANASQTDTDGDGWGNRCDADYNNDGAVNSIDLGIMRDAFFHNDPNVDLSGDGVVNAQDLGILRTYYFLAPGPAGYARWVSMVDGDWEVAGNWFPAVVPPVEAHVTIDPPAQVTVSFPRATGFLPATFAAASVTSAQDLEFIVGTLTVAGDLRSTGALSLFGTRLEVSGDFAVEGALTLASGTLANATILPNSTGDPVSPVGTITLENTVLMADLLIDNGIEIRVAQGLTMADSEIVLASDFAFTDLQFVGAQTLYGVGRIVFGGTTTADFTNRIFTVNSLDGLIVGPDVTIETDTAGGEISVMLLQGSIISDLPGRRIELNGEWLIEGSISVGEQSRADYIVNGEFNMTPAAAIDIDVGPSENGHLTFYHASLAGDLNISLVNGASPAPCDFVDVFSYHSVTGSFDSINGPDFGGRTFDLVLLEDIGRLQTPGPECLYEVSRLAGNFETASSESVFNLAENANDNSTISWWCAELSDPAPQLTVELPTNATVYQINLDTDLGEPYQFHSGRLRLVDAANNELYNSGTLIMTDGDLIHDVVPNMPATRKIVFEGLTWGGTNQPCVGEIDALGVAP